MNRVHKGQRSGGFTLIEIAIVVVIIGLLLGGVLKGQEMIRNARAHNIADQGNAVKAAILGFTDRYRALPGDYGMASSNIPGLSGSQYDGDGNSRIGFDDSNDPGVPDAQNRKKEMGLTWMHLSRSGLISGQYDGTPFGDNDEAKWTSPTANTCLNNAFNAPLIIVYDDEQAGTNVVSDTSRSNQLWSGKGIPVEIMAELDRKVDDGLPGSGGFRVGDGFIGAASVGRECALTAAGESATGSGGSWPEKWDITSQVTECGGVYSF